MRKYALCFLTVCLILSVTIIPVMADVLFSNPSMGPSAPTGVAIFYPSTAYDDFILNSESTVNSISFRAWQGGGVGAGEVTQVNWAIYAVPSSTTPLYSGVGSISSSSPAGYLFWGIFPVSDYVFSVGSLNLSSGVYWLALSNATPYTYWELNSNSSGPNTPYTPGNAIQGAEGSNGDIPYHPSLMDVVFSVNGTAPVPEPSLMVLLGISMMSIVGLRRWWKD